MSSARAAPAKGLRLCDTQPDPPNPHTGKATGALLQRRPAVNTGSRHCKIESIQGILVN